MTRDRAAAAFRRESIAAPRDRSTSIVVLVVGIKPTGPAKIGESVFSTGSDGVPPTSIRGSRLRVGVFSQANILAKWNFDGAIYCSVVILTLTKLCKIFSLAPELANTSAQKSLQAKSFSLENRVFLTVGFAGTNSAECMRAYNSTTPRRLYGESPAKPARGAHQCSPVDGPMFLSSGYRKRLQIVAKNYLLDFGDFNDL
jgi:hypothetical protein